MSEKDALQRAADEARKVARAAREFGGILDDYAKYLTQPDWRGRVGELRLLAFNKLSAINEGFAAYNKLVIESGEIAVVPAPEPVIISEDILMQDIIELNKPRTFRIKMKESQK